MKMQEVIGLDFCDLLQLAAQRKLQDLFLADIVNGDEPVDQQRQREHQCDAVVAVQHTLRRTIVEGLLALVVCAHRPNGRARGVNCPQRLRHFARALLCRTAVHAECGEG